MSAIQGAISSVINRLAMIQAIFDTSGTDKTVKGCACAAIAHDIEDVIDLLTNINEVTAKKGGAS